MSVNIADLLLFCSGVVKLADADLQKDLSQAVIGRISFYGVIHDINKEATAMAVSDDSGLDCALPGEDMNEECSQKLTVTSSRWP